MAGRLGKIAVVGAGSWATALAKLLLNNNDRINWYVRRPERIEEFIRRGRNPVYLSDVTFDTARIDFFSDINEAVEGADTLVVAIPSPYFKDEAGKIEVNLSGKNIVSAVKGLVPDENLIVTQWFATHFGCSDSNLLVIGGPCHAEEVALDHLSYLTIGCHDLEKSLEFGHAIAGHKLRTIHSEDVAGIEYGAVLKNVYAIAAGIIDGMKGGDNFKAMLVCNAIREMRRFVDAIAPMERDICRSAYLGDLLVTAYSLFSRNHNFGSMIGKGHSVKAAKMEMEMVAEGYYGTRCMHEINDSTVNVDMPILDCVYNILYRGLTPREAFGRIESTFS
ncbi:MAG: NAD(P)-binding domain-containing protein [Muribaculaceae bacterium]|nr:NAD(P)-binding domain-containing protein [Muribaculaceae bacterium]MDE7108438.1 NAD(P)-binding domain-containing protein [Muribaculaceae bacterium]